MESLEEFIAFQLKLKVAKVGEITGELVKEIIKDYEKSHGVWVNVE